MRLTTIETQLDAIQQKLEDSLQLFVPERGKDSIQKGGEQHKKEEADVHSDRGSKRKLIHTVTHTFGQPNKLLFCQSSLQLFAYSSYKLLDMITMLMWIWFWCLCLKLLVLWYIYKMIYSVLSLLCLCTHALQRSTCCYSLSTSLACPLLDFISLMQLP